MVCIDIRRGPRKRCPHGAELRSLICISSYISTASAETKAALAQGGGAAREWNPLGNRACAFGRLVRAVLRLPGADEQAERVSNSFFIIIFNLPSGFPQTGTGGWEIISMEGSSLSPFGHAHLLLCSPPTASLPARWPPPRLERLCSSSSPRIWLPMAETYPLPPWQWALLSASVCW